jgi:hypothetical protein
MQSFHFLLKRYEKSITHSLSYNDDDLAYTNMQQPIIRSSGGTGKETVTALSFPWFCELMYRSNTINFLTSHEITHMEDSTNDWPTLDVPKAELRQRLAMFKKRALLLLYQLVCDDGMG